MTAPISAGTALGARVRSWCATVGVLAGMELRQRVRTTRWKATLAAVFLVLSLGVFGSLYSATALSEATYRDWAPNLYTIVVGLELFLGVILAPTLTATAINGDRKDATLALVQATPISKWQLALGKLLGNWAACTALILIASPYLIWGAAAAPYGFGWGLLGIMVLWIIFGCYCAVGLGFSAVTARPAGSAVSTQATVFFLILGLPALFALLLPTTARDHTVTIPSYGHPADTLDWRDPKVCTDTPIVWSLNHSERIWWLLAPNPFLIIPDLVAPHDPAPREPRYGSGRTASPTIATELARQLSEARSGPYIVGPTCDESSAGFGAIGSDSTDYYARERAHGDSQLGNSWYPGLLTTVALGALGFTVAARRLSVPARRLPRGVRIA
ncbi:ABC transporter permease [Nocardia seriolae]|uniref:ABC transporter permease n=1 Tax=Nocardia seriolae TaxID=37332 RepID=A0ABC8AUR5_9NOCA|nr:ABC transporter permease subunit [Nocardia seriolae]APA97729.1 hypothetical protein NS506_03679 [Nocardia seriolae]OJF79767.1 hypothetical protein NS14008_11890 [Nocardia seriolae]PSK28356.1 ABC transporter permease [Nocardia seriolae]QOW36303.1 ABC transporter permease subunit [Nocardia seriolae]QUN16190.1 ABC transporter permease subunit [Nocardia seriolae]